MQEVYFVLAEKRNAVKIGKSFDVEARIKDLQTGCPDRLELLLVLPDRPPFEEGQLHWRFQKYQLHGEWFEYTGELQRFITQKIADPSPSADDDAALRPDKRHKYCYPKHDNRWEHNPENEQQMFSTDNKTLQYTPMRSLGYGLLPVWNKTTSQSFWHEMQAYWATKEIE